MSQPKTIIVMGVAGCGKTSIGELIAERLGGIFEDADTFHSVENKARMKAGIAMTDEDRWPWLTTLRERIDEVRDQTSCYVLACSALKEKYRTLLRKDDSRETLEFVYLKGTKELIGSRMAARKGHYMPTSLLDSQFATLEEPTDAIVVNVDQTPEEIADEIMGHFR